MIEILAQVTAPGAKEFCAGLVLWDDVAVEAAPIVGYMAKQKWTRDRIRSYCAERGWHVSVVYRQERDNPHDYERRIHAVSRSNRSRHRRRGA